jgi:HAD superfamily hydrolase (TIGR01509 family)
VAAGPVETVLVDAGGVLVEPDWDRVAAILRDAGVAAEAADLAAADPRARHALDTGTGSPPADDRARGSRYFRSVLAFAGVRATAGDLDAACEAVLEAHDRSNLYTRVYPGVPECLDSLRAEGLPLVLVSNAPASLPSLLEDLGLARRFDHLVVSAIVGCEKPDPRIFREALRVAGARAATAVHVGDLRSVDVAGARAAGIRPVLVDPADLHGDLDAERAPSLAAWAARLLASR